jgi:hypothetical protein
MAATATTPVVWDTYVRAQSDTMFKSYADDGAFGKFHHVRQPTPIDAQEIIRMNRDTLYSLGVFDLTDPVTITKPDTGNRYQSMMVLSQDEYIPMVCRSRLEEHNAMNVPEHEVDLIVVLRVWRSPRPHHLTAESLSSDRLGCQSTSRQHVVRRPGRCRQTR